ncbi:MAG: hypothetical protein LUD72_12070 [Bacteroidales bacterium]|nr:hypothetical protein [Bacteroidales bacterium]
MAEQKKKTTTFKAEVVVPFQDKYTGKIYRTGDTLKVTSERFKEINIKKRHVKRA